MTAHLPRDLEHFVQTQVRSGRYASEEEVVRAALHLLKQSEQGADTDSGTGLTEDEFERRLIEGGLMSVSPSPRGASRPPRDFSPVAIEGEPLSATVVRERR